MVLRRFGLSRKVEIKSPPFGGFFVGCLVIGAGICCCPVGGGGIPRVRDEGADINKSLSYKTR